MDFVAEQLEAEVRNGTVHYHAMDSGDADYVGVVLEDREHSEALI